MQRLCSPYGQADSVVHWRHQGPGSFPRLCFMAYTAEMGSPWQFQVKTSGHQKIMFSLTPFLEEKETSSIRPSLQSNWATLLIRTLDTAGRIQCRWSALRVGPASHMPCVPGQVREPNQDIIRKEEVGTSAQLGTNSGHSSAQGASGACARAHFSLVISLTHSHHFYSPLPAGHSHHFVFIPNLFLCFRHILNCQLSFLSAPDQDNLKEKKYTHTIDIINDISLFLNI